jgi:hypothetical protein
LEGGHRKFTNNLNRGPVKIWAFFKTSSSPPPLGVINVLSLMSSQFGTAQLNSTSKSVSNISPYLRQL